MSIKMEKLENVWYNPSEEISRTVHLDDFFACCEKGQLLPNKINTPKTTLKDSKVLWFSPASDNDEHNAYGNVTFSIYLYKLTEILGKSLKVYYIDRKKLPARIFTRVLITKKNYPELEEVRDEKGTAMKIIENFKAIQAAINANGKPHALEIGIEICNPQEARQLFEKCKKFANSHEKAEEATRGNHLCHIVSLGKPCPHPLNRWQTIYKLIEKENYSDLPFVVDKASGEIKTYLGAFSPLASTYGDSDEECTPPQISRSRNSRSPAPPVHRMPPVQQQEEEMSLGAKLAIGAGILAGAGLLTLFASSNSRRNN